MNSEKKSIGAYLKKSLKIYFRVVLAVVGVIGCAVLVVEVISRLTANDQTLGIVEEPKEPPHILQLYIDEEYMLDDLIMGKRNVEMKTGKVYMSGKGHYTRFNAVDHALNPIEGRDLFCYYNAAYYNARDVFYIDPFFDDWVGHEEVVITATCEDADIKAVNSMPIKLTRSAYDSERLTFRCDPRHDIETLRESERILTERRLTGKKATVWDGLEYNDFYMQHLRDTTDIDTGMYGSFDRYVTVSAVRFAAYEVSEPHRLLAEAIVEIHCYFTWDSFNVINMGEDETVNTALYDLDLVTPDNYGYTTVELVEYWQNEELIG